MWLLSQEQRQYGPYTEEQLQQMIASGQVRTGNVCTQGQSQWVPIEQHPVFGRMLGAAAGGAAGPRGPGATATVSDGGRRMLRWLLGSIGMVMVIGVCVGVVRQILIGSTGQLAKVVPADVELYLEVADVPGALSAALEMDIIDASRIETDRQVGAIVDGLVDAFEIESDVARALVDDFESVAVAVRQLDGRSEGAFIVHLSDSDAMEILLATKRFQSTEPVGKEGRRQLLWPAAGKAKADREEREAWSPWRRSFARMHFDEDRDRNAMVWFPERGLLVMGELEFIEDMARVIDGERESLAKTERWRTASFEWGADGIGYLDPVGLDGDRVAREFVRAYLGEVSPMTFSIALQDAGIVSTVQGTLAGTEIASASLPDPADLSLFRRLPVTTVGYLSVSSRSELSGHELRAALVRQARSFDAGVARAADEALDELREELGDVGIEEAWDTLGDELVLATSVAPGARVRPGRDLEESLDDLAFGLVLDVGERDAARRVVETIRRRGFEDGPLQGLYEVSSEGDGFVAAPERDELPHIHVAFVDDLLVAAVGGASMVAGFIDAVEGDAPRLGDSPVHERAIGALHEGARVYAWVDLGRLAMLSLASMEDAPALLDTLERETTVSPRVLVIDGDERVAFAAALHLDAEGDAWRYRIETLNFELLVGGSGALAYVQAQRARAAMEEAQAEMERQRAEAEAELERLQQGL